MMIEPTDVCNLKCPLCPSGNGKLKRAKGFMDFSLFKKIIDEIITTNEKLQDDIKERPDRAQKFIMGQLMKITKGQANPKESNILISKKLNN